MTPESLLFSLSAKSVALRCDDGKLKWTAPEGAITADDLIALKLHKAAIIDLLQMVRPVAPGPFVTALTPEGYARCTNPPDLRCTCLWLAGECGYPSRGTSIVGESGWQRFSAKHPMEQIAKALLWLDEIYVERTA